MPDAPPVISFLSDYGYVDEFAGVCRSVLAQLAPASPVIDITHGIPAFDVRAGSLALVRAVQYLADGVVLAIVDPGVGTPRRAIAVRAGSHVFVGPDNGLLAPAVAMAGGAAEAVVLDNDDYHLAAPGPTFAGRDVFAPVAAHLCSGVALEALGTRVDPATLLPGMLPLVRNDDGAVHAEVLWVDGYGNAQLNAGDDDVAHLDDVIALRFGGRVRIARRARTYGDIGPGAIGLVVDSYGLLSVCLDRGSAAAELGITAAMAVTLADPDHDDAAPAPGTRTAVQLSAGPATNG